MLSRMRTAGLLWPTLLAIPALAVLVSLGNWQMSRKSWKDGLQSQIRERTVLPPASVENVITATHKDGADLEYTRVVARGRFIHGLERHVYWPASGGPGWLIHTPMLLQNGWVVLVNRGWVPDQLRDPAARAGGQLAGTAEAVGLLRAPDRAGMFTPANNPARNTWFWRDLQAMLRCSDAERASVAECKVLETSGPHGKQAPTFAFLVDQEAEPAPPGGWPRGGTTNLNLSNRHLEYAATWYGLAATLVGVWLAFCFSRLRRSGASEP